MSSAHLLIIGDRAALSWVVTSQRMAFPARRAKAARTREEGAEIFSTRRAAASGSRPAWAV
ncbi:hypothetical protein ACFW2D_30165 [Streptomyces sp. NPDC058914]|uniref:hypothetical protein n=1 Tax=Streptomyces TaxID=1883 RepID=UPI0036CCAFD9